MGQRDIFPYAENRGSSSSVFSQTSAPRAANMPATSSTLQGASGSRMQEPSIFRGEALARAPQLERSGGWIVLIFTVAFALFLIYMNIMGQVPGQSFLLKSISDILQFAGECIGLVFCLLITFRLGRTSTHLASVLRQLEFEGYHTNSEMVIARNEAQSARRAFLAWTLLSLAVAVYASGQAIWTSYDVRMPSFQVPFPGIYDIGFVSSYPFFLLGTLLLTRRSNRAGVGRARLLLDAFAVIGAALALSWFFVLDPSIAGLPQAPNPGAAFLSIYFPSGDLLLVAVGAFLMFSPLSTREQQPVFVRLCLGLFFLAVTDSLLGYFSLSPSGFNTGTLQDILWPLSMQMVGLAAIAYPQGVAREQERAARGAGDLTSFIGISQLSQLTLTLQTVAPFILALSTCAILLTVVPMLGGKSHLFLAPLIALTLFLIVAIRQALTLNENNRLRMHLAGELVLSRRELQITRREADAATRDAQEKQQLEQGVAALQEVHARLASGDFNVRVSIDPGPLQALSISFNLIIERLKDLAVRAGKYDQLVSESRILQEVLDQLGRGAAVSSPIPDASNSSTELRPLFLGVERFQRFHLIQWKNLLSALERVVAPLSSIRSANVIRGLDEAGNSGVGDPNRALGHLEQQLQRLIVQTRTLIARLEEQLPQQAFSSPTQSNIYHTGPDLGKRGSVPQTPRPGGYSQLEESYQSDAYGFPHSRLGRGDDRSS